MAEAHFSPELFEFMSELRENNDKDWFDANKKRYQETVQEPSIRFILDFGPRLKKISPHFRADPRKNGGSLFRIYRNRRFQPKAPPYKEHTGIQFRHEEGKDAHAPGFYLHLAPDGCFLGLGTWHPDSSTLKDIRESIAQDPKAWSKATGKPFSERFELAGDSLKRPPRGFDPEHPAVEDLKRKDFVGLRNLSIDQITSADFLDAFTDACRDGQPFVKWLCGATGVAF